ncbi:uncharacterized protein LAESUDRAFT_816255 [Laetiporus sulphureus 93-53]|uniref:Uncharacterized protein n=1 Tax=Laetiporus sulphureus 93-53 TaxID=1314785 RepID=A0A165BEW2_9APHY|nr:uncharacterized protein LAESUDRAFT_816255 [Laetiporus sulphureus 93-53]KZT00906.1 hypothetical protein LAESUDRAFT_816255 [Laetiporus sulphureus 93-53]
MASFLAAFNASLIRRPMLTQCASAAFMFGMGDVIAQQAFERKSMNHDLARTARTAFYGGCLFGPLLTKWLGLLNRLQFSTPLKSVVYKVWLDQTTFTPFVIGFFFSSMTLLEGKPIAAAFERISESYVPTVFRNWCVFVPTQVINFAYVPAHLRFFTIGVVALFWNAYLSAVNARDARAAELVVASVNDSMNAAEMGMPSKSF